MTNKKRRSSSLVGPKLSTQSETMEKIEPKSQDGIYFGKRRTIWT